MARSRTSNGTKDSSASLGFEAKLWLAADKLRSNMDAAEYKHVVLGLIFLKYISDKFEEHHAKLATGKGEYKGADPEDPDEYKAENVFWVPPAARWAYFIVFEEDPENGALIKKVAGYHQFHAVNTALAETIRASAGLEELAAETPGGYFAKPQADGAAGDKRVGVVWHTQGSGKSLTMVFYAGRLVLEPAMENPTLVVLTDRNDLDGQLYDTFIRCHELLRQKPEQAQDRDHLKKLLAVASGGVVFTTIQKFFPEEKGAKHPLLSDRRNIVVIADEAHRTQYDFIDGFARHMRDALPNASFIGFTGTPIEKADANTRAVFGDYISIYDIQRAVEDKATVPIYYESRLAKLELKPAEKPKIDPDFEEATEGEEVARKERLKTKWAALEAKDPKPDEYRQRFLQAVVELSKAFALAVPHEKALEIRDDVGFFQAVRAAMMKGGGEKKKSAEDRDHAIRQIISRAVASDEVIDIFAAAGLKKPDISILSEQFLAEVRELPQKNLAVELLRKLLSGEIKLRARKYLIQSKSFAALLEVAIRKYQNRAIEAAAVIEELIKIAKDIREADQRGEASGLTPEERAFYDALADNESAVQAMGSKELRVIATELVTHVRNSVTIDWTLRESARAKIKVMVKRILRKHGYPPDLQEEAVKTVLAQAELLCADWAQ